MVIQKMNIIKYLRFWVLWVGLNILARGIVVLATFELLGRLSLYLIPILILIPIAIYTVLAFFEYFLIKRRLKTTLFRWVLSTFIGLIVSYCILVVDNILYYKYATTMFHALPLLVFYDQLGQGLYLMTLKCFSNIGKIIWLAGTVISMLIGSYFYYFYMESFIPIILQCIANGILLLTYSSRTKN